MKIAYLVNQYPKVSHTFVRREIVALQREGVDVLRLSVRPPPEALVDPQDQDEARLTRVLLAGPKWRIIGAALVQALRRPRGLIHSLRVAFRLARRSERGLLRHLAYLAEACLLVRFAAREGIRHVHSHFGTNSTTVALLAHELAGLRFSFTAHGPEEFDKAAQWSLGEKIDKAAFVVGISHFGRSQLCRQCDHRLWHKIHVVRCGVDGEFLEHPASPMPRTRRLISIGRLAEQKGQLLLIEALGQLRRQGIEVELDLIGDGELRPELEQAISTQGLAGQVRITGWVDGDAIRRALDECSAFVLPSFAEGLPVVIMEAMARERPVLSTYVAGIPELVIPGTSGWLIPAGSVDHLANALREVVTTDFQVLGEMGRSGRRSVAEQHDIRQIARRLAELFRISAIEE